MKKWTNKEIALTAVLCLLIVPGIICALIILKMHGDIAKNWTMGEYVLTIVLYVLGILHGIICMLVFMGKKGELKKIDNAIRAEAHEIKNDMAKTGESK